MIRRALIEDGEKILKFINNKWKKDHYFIKNKNFFYYFYTSLKNDYLNFYISEDSSKSINGILGFIDYSFDKKDISNIAIALWKVSVTDDPSLGIKLFQYLRSDLKISNLLCLGINKDIHIICKYLGFHVNKLKKYLMINNIKENYKILDCEQFKNDKFKPAYLDKVKFSNCVKLTSKMYNDIVLKKELNFKSFEYFNHRYFQHPVYKYDIHTLELDKQKKALFVTRKISHNTSNIVRVVDFMGSEDCISNSYFFFQELLKNNNAEYIEFIHYGLNKRLLKNAGFIKLNEKKLIMPIYFQPFINENIDIYFFSSKNQKLKLFMGDGDQDRPN